MDYGGLPGNLYQRDCQCSAAHCSSFVQVRVVQSFRKYIERLRTGGGASLNPPLPLEEPNHGSQDEFGATAKSIHAESWKRIFHYAYSLVHDWAEAEDLTQETFVELFRAEATGKTVEWVGAWMRVVTRRLASRSFRERRPDLHTSLDTVTDDGRRTVLDVPDSQPSPEARVIDQAMVRLSAKVLSELSERERECVLMYFRGYDYARIASVLGISRWTARRVTLSVVKKVRARLQPAQKR
ncbi:RNA polymerase sigma factor [Paracidobacterium acidisoli]|nr:sigma-70 family RNA polymerase sigma factor [Paracidobacterium acidisoli]MBT9332991.1 sigma-70 family RNA polymerase sigma factor [Paracidobacterium acidisoli]